MFNIPPTAKVIWRQSHDLESQMTIWCTGPILVFTVCHKVISLVYSLFHYTIWDGILLSWVSGLYTTSWWLLQYCWCCMKCTKYETCANCTNMKPVQNCTKYETCAKFHKKWNLCKIAQNMKPVQNCTKNETCAKLHKIRNLCNIGTYLKTASIRSGETRIWLYGALLQKNNCLMGQQPC